MFKNNIKVRFKLYLKFTKKYKIIEILEEKKSFL